MFEGFETNNYVDVKELKVVPRNLIGIGVGACAALALRVSIPGGMLAGLCYKLGTLVLAIFVRLTSFNPGPLLGLSTIFATKTICAIAGASIFFNPAHALLIAISFVAVDAFSLCLYNDLWMI